MLAADHFEPYDAPEPDGCNCEQALQETCEKFKRNIGELMDEIASLKQSDRDAWTLAQEVLQAVTLDEAKQKASIYLGLEQSF